MEKQINARIPEEMHRAIKMKAAKEGRTMTEIFVTLLKEWLEEDEQTEQYHQQQTTEP